MKQILVGGGASSLVFGNLSRKLNKVNLKVAWHVSDIDGDKYTNLPTGCEGVIILRDMIGHTLFYSIVAEAKKRDIPLAAVPRKWSHAEPILRLQGFLPTAHPLKKAAPRDVVLETAVFYMDRERAKDRVPKIDEVEAVVRKTLGPKSSLSQDEYKVAVSRSAAVNATKRKPVKAQTLKASEIGLWVETVLEEHPEKATNARKLTVEMLQEYGNVPQAALLVNEAVAVTKKRWKSRLATDLKWRNGIIHRWLVRWFRRAVDGNTKIWPTYSTVGKQTRSIFNVKVSWSLVQAARAEVLGDWAYELNSVASLEEYYSKSHPSGSGAVLEEAILGGLVESVMIPVGKKGSRQYTSKKAINDYLDALRPKAAPPVKKAPKKTPPDKKAPSTKPPIDPEGTVCVGEVVFKPVDPAEALLEATKSLQVAVEALTSRVGALETPAKGTPEVSLDFGELLSRLPNITIKIELHPRGK